MALLVYRRKGLKWFGPNRYELMPQAQRLAWLAAAREIAQTRIAKRLDDQLRWPQRARAPSSASGTMPPCWPLRGRRPSVSRRYDLKPVAC